MLAQHQVPLIEDDVYGDLCFTHERPWPVKAYDTAGFVLLCSSFSKAVTPASRVGLVAAGRWTQQVALLSACRVIGHAGVAETHAMPDYALRANPAYGFYRSSRHFHASSHTGGDAARLRLQYLHRSSTDQPQTNKEHIMNVLKNMEVIFVFAAALGTATGYATASEPVIAMAAKPAAAAVAATDVKMPVVVIRAKRLTVAEKAAL